MSSRSSSFPSLQTLKVDGLEGGFPSNLIPFLGFLLSKSAQAVVTAVDVEIAQFSVTSKHYGVMLMLAQQDGMQQAEVGEKLKIDRSTMVKLVDALEKQNLVERHRDPNDRRAYALSLSEKGKNILPEISQQVIDSEQVWLSKLEPEEIKQLFKILLKLLQESPLD